jgi:hypothetical protein
MTRKAALAFGIGASLMLAAGTASAAGTCGTEVAALQQQLGMQQGANATTGPSDPGVQQPSPSASVDTSTGTSSTMDSDQVANSNSGANATIGASDPGVQQTQPEANATTGTGASTGTSTTADSSSNGSSVNTNNENSGANATIGATDPGVQQPSGGGGDVQAQNNADSSASGSSTTMPSGTVTETSRAGDLNTAVGGHAEAITALKKAQLHAEAGEEDACMTELGAAKTALGIQ